MFCKPPAALPAPATSDPRHRALFLPRPLPVTPGALPAPVLPPRPGRRFPAFPSNPTRTHGVRHGDLRLAASRASWE